jgi:hypothetical protein
MDQFRPVSQGEAYERGASAPLCAPVPRPAVGRFVRGVLPVRAGATPRSPVPAPHLPAAAPSARYHAAAGAAAAHAACVPSHVCRQPTLPLVRSRRRCACAIAKPVGVSGPPQSGLQLLVSDCHTGTPGRRCTALWPVRRKRRHPMKPQPFAPSASGRDPVVVSARRAARSSQCQSSRPCAGHPGQARRSPGGQGTLPGRDGCHTCRT